MSYDVVTAEFCADYHAEFEVPGSKPGTSYRVFWSGGEGPAHCTCPAFKFSGAEQHCKHVDYVFKHGCFWNPQWYEGGDRKIQPVTVDSHTVPGGACPHCGGPTIAVRIAV